MIVTHEEDIGLQAKRLIRMRDGVIQSDECLAPLPKKIKINEKEQVNFSIIPTILSHSNL